MNTGHAKFLRLCAEVGSSPMAEETAILSVGSEFLPPCAIAVRDGGEATEEYWEWLCGQTAQAQAEHDAEYAAGHEWHREEK